MIEGSQGLLFFREILGKAEANRVLFSKSQKLRMAALKRRADKHDLLADWQPLVDAVFLIWEEAIRGTP